MQHPWQVILLLTAMDELEQAVADLREEDLLTQIQGGSCIAWTLAHVTYGVDSWINGRFQLQPLNPELSRRHYGIGGDGSAASWPPIRDGVADVRARVKPFLLTLTDEDMAKTVPYDGAYVAFQANGINLGIALAQNAMHHVFHLGEIVTKRELLGYFTGTYPGAFGPALLGQEYVPSGDGD